MSWSVSLAEKSAISGPASSTNCLKFAPADTQLVVLSTVSCIAGASMDYLRRSLGTSLRASNFSRADCTMLDSVRLDVLLVFIEELG